MTAPADSEAVRTLVQQLGGPTEVGEALGLSCEAVCMWYRRNAVPDRHHLALWRIAKARGLAWQPPGTEGLRLAEEGPVPSNDTHRTAA